MYPKWFWLSLNAVSATLNGVAWVGKGSYVSLAYSVVACVLIVHIFFQRDEIEVEKEKQKILDVFD